MNDILPDKTPIWQQVEAALQNIFASYGYDEVRFPMLEKTALFARSIGEVTDIVEKEMYSFDDKGGENITLRPEGTAGCVRAMIEHGAIHNQIQRLWYVGPMFRYERPQKGRYRQFYQAGAEVFGLSGPDIDAELILMTARLWKQLGIEQESVLQINSLGDKHSRENHKKALVNYFETHKSQLDEDSIRRLEQNPLRILDSKNPEMQQLISEAPQITDYLDEASAADFSDLQSLLNACGVSYQLNPKLVRGLDYYNKTVFEWTTSLLGAQDAICGGGRYDELVTFLGGRATPAVGFAIGLERLIELVLLKAGAVQSEVDVYMMSSGDIPASLLPQWSEKLRDVFPMLKIQMHCGGGSLKSQMKKADKSGAKLALIFGEEEVSHQSVAVKHLRESVEQQVIPLDGLTKLLSEAFGKS